MMTTNFLRALAGLTTFVVVVSLFWIAGVDLFARGEGQGAMYTCALVLAVYAACCPYIKGKDQ